MSRKLKASVQMGIAAVFHKQYLKVIVVWDHDK